MRIPSGLDDGNLYRRRHQKGNDSFAYRRLLRLVLALVLIVVLMQQAGKPNVYRIFFSDPSQAPTPARTYPNRMETNSADSADSVEFAETSAGLSQNQSLDRAPERKPDSLAIDSSSPREQSSLREQRLLENVDDGAIWKAGDQPAFYRILEGSPLAHLAAVPSRRVGVIPLLQQPAVYLQSPISIHGVLARASRREAVSNEFGISSYWELWLQPDDGSNRPVVFYARDVPGHISKWDGIEFLADGPAIDIEGIYLKRLAYQSAAGTELAPVVVGKILSFESEPTVAMTVSRDQAGRPSMPVLVLLALALGASLTAVICVATALSSRRIRQARLANQHVPEHLFSSLANDVETREPT